MVSIGKDKERSKGMGKGEDQWSVVLFAGEVGHWQEGIRDSG